MAPTAIAWMTLRMGRAATHAATADPATVTPAARKASP